tara:strand:- start:598 stop:846 length:249 start_codon:yes stop_codon:yes gene_type:complete
MAGLCWEGSEMVLTEEAEKDMIQNEACHCENFFYQMETIEERLLDAIKIGRFTYGKQVNKAMLMAELEGLLDSAIADYGKEI